MLVLVLLGLGCLAAGTLWAESFPIIKRRWTSTYVLHAGGWSPLRPVRVYETPRGRNEFTAILVNDR